MIDKRICKYVSAADLNITCTLRSGDLLTLRLLIANIVALERSANFKACHTYHMQPFRASVLIWSEPTFIQTRHFSLDSQVLGPRWLSWMCHPTGDQEVPGSTPAEVGNILSWRLIMKYFLQSFSPFR